MVYKKYIKRKVNGKVRTFGPYYYESYRDKDGIVRTRYIEDYKPKSSKKKILLVSIIFLLLGIVALTLFLTQIIQIPKESTTVSISGEPISEISSQKSISIKQISEFFGNVFSSIKETASKIAGFAVSEEEPVELPVEEAPPEESGGEPTTKEEKKEEKAEEKEEKKEEAQKPIEEPVEEVANETAEEIPTVEENITEIPENVTEEINVTIPENITLPENITEITSVTEIINITKANITVTEEIITNITITNETIIISDETFINITTKKAKIVINRPVKWIKKIRIENAVQDTNLSLELPKQSENITIRTGQEVQEALDELDNYEKIVNQVDRGEIKSGTLTGLVSLEINKRQGILTRFWNWLRSLTITGNVIQEQEMQQDINETIDSKIVDVDNIVNLEQEQDIAVEYYTDAPLSFEENITNGKRVTVSAADELGYTDVLAYAELDNKIPINNSNRIKVYWYVTPKTLEEVEETEKIIEEAGKAINETEETVNETAEQLTNETIEEAGIPVNESQTQQETQETEVINETTEQKNIEKEEKQEKEEKEKKDKSITGAAITEETQETTQATELIKQEVNFTAYDLDSDGYIDYIEWQVPYLSNQTFDIIYITKAVHLDENREFVSDIYEQVKTLDNNWSETINPNEYVRVTFERALDKTKDITLYARINVEQPNQTAEIEVYTENSSQLITTINNITTENWYKTYLTGLGDNESYDTFDLKILNLAVEFDYIVDPQIFNATAGTSTIWDCGNITSNGTYTFNQSITTTETCIRIQANNVTLDMNGFNMTGDANSASDYGISISGYNSTTVKNGKIYNFGAGIYSVKGWNGNFTNLTITANGDFGTSSILYGIYITGSNNSITNNNISNLANSGGAPHYVEGISLASGSSSNTIKDNVVNSNTASGNSKYVYVIMLSGSSNNIIQNNILNSNIGGTDDSGIYLTSSSHNNTIQDNTANSNDYGIVLENSDNNTLTNNTANSNSNAGFSVDDNTDFGLGNILTNNTANSNTAGIVIDDQSNISLINNNIWNCTSTGNGCLQLYNVYNSTISGGIINLSAGNLISFVTNSDNNIFKDMQLIGATKNDTFLTGNSINNTFTNVTYNISRESVASGSRLIRKWYYKAYVNDTAGKNVSAANITAYNVSSAHNFNLTTDATGYTAQTEIIDYINTGATSVVNRTYYSPYTIWALNSSYPTKNVTYNATSSQNNYAHNIMLIEPSNVTDCGTLDKANTTYTLTKSLSTTVSCLVVGANNITVNMNGFNMTGDSAGVDSGVYVSGYNQSTIKNGKIYNFTYGIYLENNQNNNITNITSNSNDGSGVVGIGILLSSSSNNTLTSNTANSNLYYGIELLTSSNNIIQDSTANSHVGTDKYGILLSSSSNNNQLINNTVNSNTNGIYLDESSNNTLTNNNLWNCPSSNFGCLHLSNGDNNTITGGIINNSNKNLIILDASSDNNIFKDIQLIGATKNDTFLTGTSINNNFTNVTYNISREWVASGSQLIRYGYLTRVIANVTYSGNSSVVANANVSLLNSSSAVLASNLSNSAGLSTLDLGTPTLSLYYTNNGGTRTDALSLSTVKAPYLTESTALGFPTILQVKSDINGDNITVALHYSTYTVSITQNLHDIYTTINDSRVFSNVSTAGQPCRYIANVSINVTGNMVMESCTLEMESIGTDFRTLSIDTTGTMTMNYSNLTAYDTSRYYNFYSLRGTTLTLKNSYINYVGTDNSNYKRGLEINSTNLVFDNITMSKNRLALIIWAPNLAINRSKISGSDSLGGGYGDNIRVAATGAIIADSNISGAEAGLSDIAIDANMDVSAINSNYSSVGFGSGATLYKKWHYRAYVNDSNSGLPLVGVNVSDFNVSNVLVENWSTNSSGYVDQALIDYSQNSAGAKTYYSNHTIYVQNTSYRKTLNQTHNATSEGNIYNDYFSLDNLAPVVTIISTTSTGYTFNATDVSIILNCTLTIGGTLASTDTNISNSGANETIAYSTSSGTHNYILNCTDEQFNSGTASGSITIATVTTPLSGGGGGGGGADKIVAVKINVPAPIIMYEPETIKIPISIKNTGQSDFNQLDLEASSDNENVKLSLDKKTIAFLAQGKSENIMITAEVTSLEVDTYEIKIKVTSPSLKYSTDNSVYINVVGTNASGVRKTVVFADDMIVGNPECLELKEMIIEADQALEQGNYQVAIAKTQEAVEACKEIISGPKRPSYPQTPSLLKGENRIIWYVIIGSAAAIIFGILINVARKIAFRRKKIKSEMS